MISRMRINLENNKNSLIISSIPRPRIRPHPSSVIYIIGKWRLLCGFFFTRGGGVRIKDADDKLIKPKY